MAARKKWSAIPTALHNHYERQIRVRNNHQNHSLIEGLQWKIIISCEWTYCFQIIYNFIDWRIVNLIYWSNYYVVINFTLFWVWPVPKKKISWTTPMLNARFLCTCIRSPLRLKKEQMNGLRIDKHKISLDANVAYQIGHTYIRLKITSRLKSDFEFCSRLAKITNHRCAKRARG